MPGDSLGHYRHLFNYELLYDGWCEAGRPDESLLVKTPDYQYNLRVLWDGETPNFLLPHGYLFLDWARPMIDRQTDIALVIAATGTSKTSSVAIAMLTYCALIPGYSFMNGAPTDEQSSLMIDEMEKWVSGTAFQKFVIPTNRGELFIKKPSALVEICSPVNPLYPSRFVCKTTGRNANNALGKNLDCACLDEIQLMENIDDITDKFATRFRAQRPTGEPRDGKMLLLTNPGDNPNLGIVASKIERLIERNAAIDRGEIIEDKDKPRVTAIFIKDLDSSVNLYITRRQRAKQEALVDAQSKRRWLQGMIDTSSTNRMIPPDTIQRCIDRQIDEDIRMRDMYNPLKIDGLGVIYYEMPREEGRTYIVLGDPGHTAPTRVSYNNVGVVIVLDVTDFLAKPSRVVYLELVGDGTNKPWFNSFKYAMLKYRAKGYYDATNVGITGYEDAGAFADAPIVIREANGDLSEVSGIRTTYRTTPVTFGGHNQKKWARTIFLTLAEDRQFGWPMLERLTHEAAVYKESGVDVKKIADDVLAALFVFSLALQGENALWDKFVERYEWNINPDEGKYADEDEELMRIMEQDLDSAVVSRFAARGAMHIARGEKR